MRGCRGSDGHDSARPCLTAGLCRNAYGLAEWRALLHTSPTRFSKCNYIGAEGDATISPAVLEHADPSLCWMYDDGPCVKIHSL